jgi:lipoprotein-releasing system permease protein
MRTLRLIVYIAVTHVRFRLRQTLVAIAGVATGVGFSIMMAALMEGSQRDFMRQLIDALPHITVSDDLRKPPTQPAEVYFGAAQIHGLTPEIRRKGIKNPMAIMASLESWVPGAVAPSVKTQALIRYAGRDIGASVVGIDPHREPKVSALATQMRLGTLASLYRANNAIILGDRLAERIGQPRACVSMPKWLAHSAPASALSTKARPMFWSRPARYFPTRRAW